MKLNTPGLRVAKNNVPLAARALQSALSAFPLPAARCPPPRHFGSFPSTSLAREGREPRHPVPSSFWGKPGSS